MRPRFPRPRRLEAIGWIRACAVLVALAGLGLALRPGERIADKPFTEDGFYALTVARNVAMGRGVTIDGEILTNGFQPLFTFLTVPAHLLAGGDRYLALRWVTLLHAMTWLGTAFLLGLIVRDAFTRLEEDGRDLFWLTVLLYLGSLHVLEVHFNGLETGTLLLVYALAARRYQVRRRTSVVALVGLGILLGLLVLARIDAVIFVAVLVAFLFFARPREMAAVRGSTAAILVGSTAVLVSLPWWAYNVLGFGTLMPSSGTSQQSFALSLNRMWRAATALTQVLMPWVPTLHFIQLDRRVVWATPLALLVLLLAAATLGASVRRRLPQRDDGRARRAARSTGLLVVAMGILVVAYVLFFGSTHFYPRYFAPLLLPTVAVAAVTLRRVGRRQPVLVTGVAVALAASVVAGVAAMHTGRVFRGNEFLHDQLALARQRVPEGEPVAAGQTGTLGYFRDAVVNLDGKVNPEVLAFQRRMPEYLEREDVRWFVDWASWIERYLGPRPEQRGWTEVARRGDFRLLHREPTGADPGAGDGAPGPARSSRPPGARSGGAP